MGMIGQGVVTMAGVGGGKIDERSPNQKRLDAIIDQNKTIIVELQKFNQKQDIIGNALMKLLEPKVKKAVDKK
jgi:hypothetical protein